MWWLLCLCLFFAWPLSVQAQPTTRSMGIAADGAAMQGNPVPMAGVDGTNTVRALKANADGSLQVGLGAAATAATVNAGNNGISSDTTLNAAVANTRLLSYSVRESAVTAAAATVILRHGVVSGTCTGNEIAYVELAGNESIQMDFTERGLAVASGICADMVAGTIDIATHTVVEAAP